MAAKDKGNNLPSLWMSILQQILALLRQEVRLEARNPYGFAGVGLYVLAAVLVAYAALTRFSPMLWNPLFWILLFFAAISATGRSFQREQGRRQLYYYSLVKPEALLLAKICYNSLVLLILGLLLWGLMALFNGSDVALLPDGSPQK
ncbi:MAG: hypothetical protein HC821_01415 [Lewinella sp.]|nr:hypothetical protein [Lewinella sp.]